MQSPKRAVLYGIAVWLLALLVSMIIFPLKASWPALFESIMPVTLALLAVVFCHLYFRRCAGDFLREGAWLGATWLGINLLFDLPLFSWGPMKVPLVNYLADVGLTYLILPIITTGLGMQMDGVQERPAHEGSNV
ncbi:MAG TPA: hypothetical protein VFD58_30050 [Blastocatellia bacterium]|nr:hypothetical protein [Blastocatellia bacterium]